MAGQQSIGLTLVSPEAAAADSGDWLKIVQPEWAEPPDGGFGEWLAINGYGYSLATLMLYWSKYKSHCLSNGSLDVELEIHKSRPDLAYTLTASWGTLSERSEEGQERTRSITINGQAMVDLEQQVVAVTSLKWEGAVYDLSGAPIIPPAITRTGSLLSWGVEVVGVLRINYAEDHDSYTLTIEPRERGEYDENDIASAYESTVIAIYSGTTETHEVKLPRMSGNCTLRTAMSSGDGDDDDGDEPGDGDCYDLYQRKHRCTGEVLSERRVKVPCPGAGE